MSVPLYRICPHGVSEFTIQYCYRSGADWKDLIGFLPCGIFGVATFQSKEDAKKEIDKRMIEDARIKKEQDQTESHAQANPPEVYP